MNWTKPTATDNSGNVILTVSHEPGTHFYIGKTVVTYTAEDPSRNKAFGTFDVTVTGICFVCLFVCLFYLS